MHMLPHPSTGGVVPRSGAPSKGKPQGPLASLQIHSGRTPSFGREEMLGVRGTMWSRMKVATKLTEVKGS